jgi:hypothetical protein
VLMRVHQPQMRKMGLNPERTDHYLAYVRYLYDQQGLTPWQASKHCWNKGSTPPRGQTPHPTPPPHPGGVFLYSKSRHTPSASLWRVGTWDGGRSKLCSGCVLHRKLDF